MVNISSGMIRISSSSHSSSFHGMVNISPVMIRISSSCLRYGKKYYGSRLEQADTGPWRRMRDREIREEERER